MLQKNGLWLVVVQILVLATMGASTAVAEHHEMTYKNNHYKCYPVLDWGEWEPKGVKLTDQFGDSEAKVMVPQLLCNPVDKNGEGIVDKDNHLVCYSIRDDPSGPHNPVEEVYVSNQFGGMSLWVGVPGRTLCLPSSKKHIQD